MTHKNGGLASALGLSLDDFEQPQGLPLQNLI